MDSDVKQELLHISARLDRLEAAVRHLHFQDLASKTRPAPPATGVGSATSAGSPPVSRPTYPMDLDEVFQRLFLGKKASRQEPTNGPQDLPVTQIMGWAGVTLLVIAAAYLIRLVYDTGWLTPQRQVLLAVASAIAMIGIGLRLRSTDDRYASLAAAGGVVVLFLSIYGAHLYYHLVDAPTAIVAVVLACFLCLGLGAMFTSELLGLFSVIGSYSAPFLLPVAAGDVADLAIYFTGWSVLFCSYALATNNRRPYLLAGYLALIAFHANWEHLQAADWLSALWFQLAQFAIFLGTAIGFSVRSGQPMTPSEANAHLPLLLIFYFLQYQLLHSHVPEIAPWIAIGSGLVLLLAYLFAERVIHTSLRASGYIVGAYCALVIFHAGFVDLLSDSQGIWIVLVATPLCAWLALRGKELPAVAIPFVYLAGVLFVFNFSRTLLDAGPLVQSHSTLVGLLFTLELYVAYFLSRRRLGNSPWPAVALFGAHIYLMRLAFHELPNPFAVSFAWGAFGITTLVLAYGLRNKLLGQSSLAIFFACVFKVLMFDLSDATPLLRIGSLVAVGISVFIGGLIYKKFLTLVGDSHTI